MENLTTQNLTKRRYLSGDTHRHGRARIPLDMEAVYRDMDSGMTLKMLAEKYKVSCSTLDRRHKEYQNMIEKMEEEEKNKVIQPKEEYTLPPLPKVFN